MLRCHSNDLSSRRVPNNMNHEWPNIHSEAALEQRVPSNRKRVSPYYPHGDQENLYRDRSGNEEARLLMLFRHRYVQLPGVKAVDVFSMSVLTLLDPSARSHTAGIEKTLYGLFVTHCG